LNIWSSNTGTGIKMSAFILYSDLTYSIGRNQSVGKDQVTVYQNHWCTKPEKHGHISLLSSSCPSLGLQFRMIQVGPGGCLPGVIWNSGNGKSSGHPRHQVLSVHIENLNHLLWHSHAAATCISKFGLAQWDRPLSQCSLAGNHESESPWQWLWTGLAQWPLLSFQPKK
jgi:hypothetical protein